jgi:uncharacterized protein YbaA (DUF1428 family)
LAIQRQASPLYTGISNVGSKHRLQKIVFTWQIWPDRKSFFAAEAKMHEDARLDNSGAPPFDAKRLILGCFEPIFAMGRKADLQPWNPQD